MAYHRTGAWVPCRIYGGDTSNFVYRPYLHSSSDFMTLLGIGAAVSQEKRQRWSLSNVVYVMQERWDEKWHLQSVAKNLNISSPKNYQNLLTQSMRKLYSKSKLTHFWNTVYSCMYGRMFAWRWRVMCNIHTCTYSRLGVYGDSVYINDCIAIHPHVQHKLASPLMSATYPF